MEAYMNRKDISDKLVQIKTLDVLLIAGSKSPYIQGVVAIHGKMDKVGASFMKFYSFRHMFPRIHHAFAILCCCFSFTPEVASQDKIVKSECPYVNFSRLVVSS